jgi:hypothetical protein
MVLALPQGSVPPRVGAVSDSRGTPRDRSTVQCYNCREFGHFQNKCPHPPRDRGPPTRGSGVPQAPCPRPVAAVARGGVDAMEDLGLQGALKPSQILSGTNNVFDPGIRSYSKDDWSADSGATIILTNDLSALHEPNVFTEPQPIFLATNAMGGTVAILVVFVLRVAIRCCGCTMCTVTHLPPRISCLCLQQWTWDLSFRRMRRENL